jgi:hypothetical protein
VARLDSRPNSTYLSSEKNADRRKLDDPKTEEADDE